MKNILKKAVSITAATLMLTGMFLPGMSDVLNVKAGVPLQKITENVQTEITSGICTESSNIKGVRINGATVYMKFDKNTKTYTVVGSRFPKKVCILLPYKHTDTDGITYTLSGIEKEAFKGQNNMTSISISTYSSTDNSDVTISRIGRNAFENCNSLVVAALYPEYIESNAFKRCPNLEYVTLDNTKGIGSFAFAHCTKLEEMTFSGSYIDEGAFMYSGIEFADMSKSSIHQIQPDTFMGCSKLKTLRIGKYTYTISENAFKYCISLNNVSFPEDVYTIDDGAFSYCTHLSNIDTPKNLKQLGEQAFFETALTSFRFYSGYVTIEDEAIGYKTSAGPHVKVPGFRIYGRTKSSYLGGRYDYLYQDYKYAKDKGFNYIYMY